MQSRGQLLHFFFTQISFCLKCEECRPNQCIKHWQLAWWSRFPENRSMYSRLGVLPANLFPTPADPPQQQRDRQISRLSNKFGGEFPSILLTEAATKVSRFTSWKATRYDFLLLLNPQTHPQPTHKHTKKKTGMDRRGIFENGGYGPAHARYDELRGYIRLVWWLLLLLARWGAYCYTLHGRRWSGFAAKRMRFGGRKKVPCRLATGEGMRILGLEIERNGDNYYVYWWRWLYCHRTWQETGKRKKGREMDDIEECWNGRGEFCFDFFCFCLGVGLTSTMVSPLVFLSPLTPPFPTQISDGPVLLVMVMKEPGLHNGVCPPHEHMRQAKGGAQGRSPLTTKWEGRTAVPQQNWRRTEEGIGYGYCVYWWEWPYWPPHTAQKWKGGDGWFCGMLGRKRWVMFCVLFGFGLGVGGTMVSPLVFLPPLTPPFPTQISDGHVLLVMVNGWGLYNGVCPPHGHLTQ